MIADADDSPAGQHTGANGFDLRLISDGLSRTPLPEDLARKLLRIIERIRQIGFDTGYQRGYSDGYAAALGGPDGAGRP